MLGTRGIWHDGWKAVTTHPALGGWGHYEQDTWELYHVETDRSELHDLAAEQPEQARRADRAVVLRGRCQPRLPARRPVGAGDHPDPTAAADPATRPLRLPAGRGRDPRVRRGQRPQPRLHHRRPGRPPGRRPPKGSSSRTAAGSAGTRSTSRTTGCTTSTTSPASSSSGSTPPRTFPRATNLILSASFAKTGEDSPGTAQRHAVAVLRRPQGRRERDPDPAGLLLPGRRGADRRPRQRGSGHRGLSRASRRGAFTGGTLHRVAVDVSGEPYLDLEREAAAMLSRE